MAENKSKKKIIIWSVVAVILVAAIVLGIIFIPEFIKKDEEAVSTEKFTEILKKHTDKPVVEIVVDDFDGDGKQEAYAATGKIDSELRGHKVFYNAEFYFINCNDKVQLIKGDTAGVINEVMEDGKTKYISVDFYFPGDSVGKSYIYTAQGEYLAENALSGQYSSVTKDGDQIIALDENYDKIRFLANLNSGGNTIIKAPAENTPSVDTQPPTSTESVITSPTEQEFDDFQWTNYLFFGYIFMGDYDCTSSDALEMAYGMMTSDYLQTLYGIYFNETDVTYSLDSDPLGYWTDMGYMSIPADNFDWIMKNVLNVTPDRNNPPTGYYHEGYFYCVTPGGFGSGLFSEDFDFQPMEDGKFRVTVTVFDEYAESDPYFYSSYEAQLKEVDGKRVWSVYNFDIDDESVNG